MTPRFSPRWIAAMGCGFVFAACGPGSSGATCPPGSTLTYENYGKGFVDTYCVRCHSSQLAGEEARQEAPEGFNFDTREGIVAELEAIDERAGAGADAVNTEMPPTGALPTENDRRKLGEWLACGAP